MSGVNVSRLIRNHEQLRRGLVTTRCILLNNSWRSRSPLKYSIEDAKIYTGNRLYRNVVSAQLGAIVGSDMDKVAPSSVPEHIGGFCLVARLTNNPEQPQHSRHVNRTYCQQYGRYTFGQFITKYDLSFDKVIGTDIWMSDGKERLSGSYTDAVQSIAGLLSNVSAAITLRTNDVILLGSPIEKHTWSDVRSVAIGINCAESNESLARMETICCHKNGLMLDKTMAPVSFEM